MGDRKLLNGDVSIDGSPVVWLRGIKSSLNYWNHWADVTSLVKTKLDSSAAGLVNFTILEKEPHGIDGEILAVIFNDPNQTQPNTVVLFFGTQKTAGDDFYIRYAAPINRSGPNLRLDFSLGISYGLQYEGNPQYSMIDVNGKRLSTAAGGEDDGFPGDGGLITVGGIGDSNDNPVNPMDTPATCRSDDELYSLVPFVAQGDTQTHIHTKNNADNDNICFTALFTSITSIVGEGILLTPGVDTNLVGTTDTLTAKVQSPLGTPEIGRMVIFEITSGPHAGLKDTIVTDNNGKALFTYTGSTIGQDEIVATMKNSTDGLISSNHAYHLWKSNVSNSPPTTNPVIISNPNSLVPTIGWTYTDADGNPQTRYEVEVWSGPNGTGAGMWDPAAGSGTSTSVTYAGFAPENGQTYYARVKAFDGTVWGAWSEVSWVARLNGQPIADAGSDRTVFATAACSSTVTLDGSGSSDPDGGAIVSYAWFLPSGRTVTGSTPGVTLPVGVHRIILTVVDDEGSNDKDTLTITVANRKPVLGALSDTAVDEGTSLYLRITASDSDGTVPRLTAAGLPAGAVFIDSANGTGHLSWIAGGNSHGAYTITITASDCVDSVKGSFLLTVVSDTAWRWSGQLTGGYYVDENADGMVDAVYLQFDKEAPIDSISVSLSWTGAKSPLIGALSGASLSYGADRAIVRVMIPATSQRANGIKTHGAMSATVRFTAFLNETRTTEVIDSAAPVIDSAVYRIGGQPAGDTLQVWFSEPVRLGGQSSPFTLNGDGAVRFS